MNYKRYVGLPKKRSNDENFYHVPIGDYQKIMGYVDRNNKIAQIFIFSQIQKMVDYLLKLSDNLIKVDSIRQRYSRGQQSQILKKLSTSCYIKTSLKNVNVVQYVNFKSGKNAKLVSYKSILVAHMIFTKISKIHLK
ncbi:hypothetical protein ACTFIZ_004951 [Dictyostelium cf. discoideum]